MTILILEKLFTNTFNTTVLLKSMISVIQKRVLGVLAVCQRKQFFLSKMKNTPMNIPKSLLKNERLI